MCKLWESSPEKKTWLSLRSAWTVLKPLQFSLRFNGRKGSKKSVFCYSIWESSVICSNAPAKGLFHECIKMMIKVTPITKLLEVPNQHCDISLWDEAGCFHPNQVQLPLCLCKCLHHAGNPLRIEIMSLEAALFSCHQSRLGINLTYTSEKILMWNMWCASYRHSG